MLLCTSVCRRKRQSRSAKDVSLRKNLIVYFSYLTAAGVVFCKKLYRWEKRATMYLSFDQLQLYLTCVFSMKCRDLRQCSCCARSLSCLQHPRGMLLRFVPAGDWISSMCRSPTNRKKRTLSEVTLRVLLMLAALTCCG